MKESILNNLKQLVLIVFSVVLGIFVSERIEERKNEKEAALLLSKIKSEVNSNKKLLEYWVPYHGEVVELLDSLNHTEAFVEGFIEDDLTLYREVLTKGTLMGRSPSSDAWDIAKSHPLIAHFDYEDLFILSKIYNQQATTYASVPRIIEILVSPNFNDRAYAKQNLQAFRNNVDEIAGREMQLMSYIKEAEDILELENVK